MQLTRRGLVGGAAASALLLPSYSAAQTTEQKRQALLDRLASDYRLPGLSVALARNGYVVYTGQTGVADLQTQSPLTRNSKFRIASVSKPITAVAFLVWASNNNVDLDGKIFEFGKAPSLAYNGNNDIVSAATVAKMKSGWSDITIRQLLTHTSGCPSNVSRDPMFNPAYAALSDDDFIATVSSTRCLNEGANGVCPSPPTGPGTQFAYSNFGYYLLGRLIERNYSFCDYFYRGTYQHNPMGCQLPSFSSKTVYESFVRQMLYVNASFDMNLADNNAPPAQNEVTYYSYCGGSPYGFNIRRMQAHGGWVATPSDVAGFGAAALTYLTPSVAADMQKPTLLSMAAGFPYGEGWGIGATPSGSATPALYHAGNLPGETATLWRQPNGDAYAAMVNCSTSLTAPQTDPSGTRKTVDLQTAIDWLGYRLFAA